MASECALQAVPRPQEERMKPRTFFRLLFAIIFAVFTLSTLDLTRGMAGVGAATGVLDSYPVNLDRLDPALDTIVPKGAVLERVIDGTTWVEGPVWIADSLYFAEIPSNSIRKWNVASGESIFLQPSGYKG